jgi:transcriptional regulator with XRE-family HTH domain
MGIKVKPSPAYLQKYRQKIGESIRENREKRGYSQDELAGIMDVTRSTISKIENGKFAVSIDYIAKFGWYLDFDIALFERQTVRQINSEVL